MFRYCLIVCLVYRPLCDDITKFANIMEQPIPPYTINDEGEHIRQRVMNAKYHKWTLNLEHSVNCVERSSICVGLFNINAFKMVKSDHKQGIKLPSKAPLSSLIMKVNKAKNINYNVVVSCHVDLNALIFPSSKGVKCLSIIRGAQIVNRGDHGTKKLGSKIKMKLMFDDNDWIKRQEMRHKIQSLSMDLTKKLIVLDKICIYPNHGGAWYYSKAKFKKSYKPNENDSRIITIRTNYINYNHNVKAVDSLRKEQLKQLREKKRRVKNDKMKVEQEHKESLLGQ